MSIKAQLVDAMKAVFAGDQRRIDHALLVTGYAEEILRGEPADEATVVAAAILHDIGIREAERKHGSSAPRFQELEGPPVARSILESHPLPGVDTEHVCRIVGSHHSARDIDSPEFRIVWDADWLVNIPTERGDLEGQRLAQFIDKTFRTATGRRIAEETFLQKQREPKPL